MFARSIVLSVALLAGSALAQNATCARSYTVQAGDICDSISAAQNVSTYQLAAVNPSVDISCDDLAPGQSLCLGYAGSDCQTTYVVKPNDDCDAISSMYAINTTVLYSSNPQVNADCDNLYVGEVLCVADSDIAPPALPGSVLPTAIPATATPAVPTSLVVASSAVSSAPAPAPTDDGSDDGEDDGDDSDLPFCDEL